jgi:beta-lactamase regulating signal transducer with metallopeptidase domain
MATPMNALGIALVWCALQVTVVGCLAALLYAGAKRIGPAARSLVASSGLVLVLALSLLMLSPWPRWTSGAASLGLRSMSPDATVAAAGDGRTTLQVSEDAGSPVRPDERAPDDPLVETNSPAGEHLVGESAIFWQTLLEELQASRATHTAPANAWRWPAIVALVFLAGVIVGLLRLLGGIVALCRFRRQCRPVADLRLLAILKELRAELGVTRSVDVCESQRLATAAMVGWRRPLILISADWPAWSDSERRAVLAHELAHVQRNDFLAWLCAQLGLVLHFYHPLVHWLAGRFRLDQELAADALAAELAGGSRCYLRILAEMALRQPARPLTGPARTFLPTRRTLLRRIEMLRDTQSSKNQLSKTSRMLLVGAMILTGLAVSGLRGPAAEPISDRPLGDDAVPSANLASENAFPTTVTQSSDVSEVEQEGNHQADNAQDSGAVEANEHLDKSVENLRRIGLAMYNYHDVFSHFPAAATGADGRTPISWRVALLPYLGHAALYRQYRLNEPWDSDHNKTLLAKMPEVYRHPDAPADSTSAAYFALTGPDTVFPDRKPTRDTDITDGISSTIMLVEAKREIPWTKPEDIPFDPKKPLPELGGFHEQGFLVLMASGAVRLIPISTDDSNWSRYWNHHLPKLITKSGGEPVGIERLKLLFPKPEND